MVLDRAHIGHALVLIRVRSHLLGMGDRVRSRDDGAGEQTLGMVGRIMPGDHPTPVMTDEVEALEPHLT